MDDSLEIPLNEISHHISCLCTSAGSQLDDVFRLNHLLPYSKFVNDIRGICINLSNYFSAHVPLLDSFVIGPVNSNRVGGALPPSNKQLGSLLRGGSIHLLVADLLNISKGDTVLGDLRELRENFLRAGGDLSENPFIRDLVESHNELLQEFVNRSSEFGICTLVLHAFIDKPQRYSEANTSISLSVRKGTLNKDWKGLLNWSLQQTPNDSETPKKPLKKEDIEFIEGAMRGIQEHDRLINNAIETILKSPKEGADNPKLLECFEILEDYYIEHPGNASNIHKIGLLDALVELLTLELKHEILEAILTLISCTLSNNESILKMAAEKELTCTLLNLKAKVAGTSLELKFLSALACSTRHCQVAETAFISLGGLEYLIELMSRNKSTKIREKAALLFYHFIILQKAPSSIMSEIPLVDVITSLLPLDFCNTGLSYCEVCARLFHALVVNYGSNITRQDFSKMTSLINKEINNLTKYPETGDCVSTLIKCIKKMPIS
ncbi:bifunctional Armadillo-type fold/Armadillo-like helical [Babesia duncani]|uniref:Bifunctional Armadillo-type fold/Armadillo-like helical n=1 Tax=Babesia duncani TaxID=323732 RepID=A0AAD9PKT7_9APIC|nr:bifunctional Armadillo-type fold/Armadillo-like helical [Babesia duncani]